MAWIWGKVNPDQVITEARARIMWGEAAAPVREFLTSNGVSGRDADVRIQEFTAERIAEIRSIGFRKTIVGAALTLRMGGFFYFDFKHPNLLTGMIASKGGAGDHCLWRHLRFLAARDRGRISASSAIRGRIHTGYFLVKLRVGARMKTEISGLHFHHNQIHGAGAYLIKNNFVFGVCRIKNQPAREFPHTPGTNSFRGQIVPFAANKRVLLDELNSRNYGIEPAFRDVQPGLVPQPCQLFRQVEQKERAFGGTHRLPRKTRLRIASISFLVRGDSGPLAMASSIHF